MRAIRKLAATAVAATAIATVVRLMRRQVRIEANLRRIPPDATTVVEPPEEMPAGEERGPTWDVSITAWRVARSLNKLLVQIDAAAPRRSRASDGSIGDPAHRNTPSDHNPDSRGVVRARDFTHDPADGADMGEISEALRRSRDRRIKYVIFNRRIFSATVQPWVWRRYDGPNPHDRHMHVSVVRTAIADNTSDWVITMPLSNDDVRRVADATAARVLGRNWSIPGRTLAGSVEALIAYGQASARADAVAEVRDLVEQVLIEVSDDPVLNVTVSAADRSIVAQRVVERLTVPISLEIGDPVPDDAAAQPEG